MKKRHIQPKLFEDESLANLEHNSGLPIRWAFLGLQCYADSGGKMWLKPRTMSRDVLPWQPEIDFADVVKCLEDYGYLETYEVGDEVAVRIVDWDAYQSPNHREARSRIPDPEHMRAKDVEVLGDIAFDVADDDMKWYCPLEKFEKFKASYPDVQVKCEMRKAALWLENNPRNRKTVSGMGRFLGNWMSRVSASDGKNGRPKFQKTRL